MRIKQIGNGDAFSPNMTNTSFLIEHQEEYLLVDCGYNDTDKIIKCHNNSSENNTGWV